MVAQNSLKLAIPRKRAGFGKTDFFFRIMYPSNLMEPQENFIQQSCEESIEGAVEFLHANFPCVLVLRMLQWDYQRRRRRT